MKRVQTPTAYQVISLSSQKALQYLSTDVTRLAHELSKGSDEVSVDHPIRAPLSKRLDEATALLSDDDLTLFWVQVLTSDGTVRTTVSNNGGDQPYPREDVDVIIETPIKYAMGVPTRMPSMYQTVILSSLFAQHALVGANTADVDVETFCDESLSMALEAGYHRDVMSDV